MSSTKPEKSVLQSPRPRRRWMLLVVSLLALAWSLPRPTLHDVVVGEVGKNSTTDSADEPNGRLAFRTARRLSELAAKGPLADETELSGPCLADEGQSLYFARSRPGQRADIMLARRDGERWSRAEPVRELNSVDDDRRVTIAADGQTLLLASNRSGTRGGFDLYESSRVRDHWTKPKNAGETLNSESDEFDPSLSSDGLTLYFVRKTSGETADIFESHRATLSDNWSAPQSVTAINSSLSHERSPVISPDGNFLYFASNRTARNSDETDFDLFRAPLAGGVVGSPIRVQDGIESTADDVDAAFSAAGRTLVFASKREGPKQLYLSHADIVTTRLGWDVEHLAPLGRAKWGVVSLLSLFFLWTIRRLRQPKIACVGPVSESTKDIKKPNTIAIERPLTPKQVTVPTASKERRAATVEQPQQRSSAAKNPLANWSVNPSGVSTTASQPNATEPHAKYVAKTGSTLEEPAIDSATTAQVPPPNRRRRLLTVSSVVAMAIALLLALNPIWRLSTDSTSFNNESLIDLVDFHDVSATRQAEQKPITRTVTARTIAPIILGEPSELVSLRQAARWPSALAIVRSKPTVVRTADEPPELARLMKQLVVSRQPIASSMLASREAMAEQAILVMSSISPEDVVAAANTQLAKQLIELSPGLRTSSQPASATNTILKMPQSRLALVSAVNIATALAVTRFGNVPRSDSTIRTQRSVDLAQSEISLPVNVTALSEQPAVPQIMAMSRSAVSDIGIPPILPQQTASNSKFVARSNIVSDVIRNSDEPSLTKNRLNVPITRQTKELRIASIVEEPLTELQKSTDLETPVAATLPMLSRIETSGPIAANAASLLVSEVTHKAPGLVRRSDVAAVASGAVGLDVMSSSDTTSLTRRVPRQLTSMAVMNDEEPLKPNTAGPALLLTSATQLVELLPQSLLSVAGKVQVSGPVPQLTQMRDGGSTKWMTELNRSRTVVAPRNDSLTAAVGAISSIPRQAKESQTAGIVEEVKPLDP